MAASSAAVTDGSTDTRWGYPETCRLSPCNRVVNAAHWLHAVAGPLLRDPRLRRRARAGRDLPARARARRPVDQRRARGADRARLRGEVRRRPRAADPPPAAPLRARRAPAPRTVAPAHPPSQPGADPRRHRAAG